MDNIGIIDAHVHIFSESVVSQRESYFHDPGFRLLYESMKSRISGAQNLLQNMDFAGVEKSFCLGFPWFNPGDCSRENEYLLKSASENHRLIPFASVPLKTEEKISSIVKKCSLDGFAGIGEIAFYVTGFNDEQERYFDNICAACQDENMSVILHINEPVGHNYRGKYITSFSRLLKIISRYPDCKIMLSHWGGGLFIYELMPEIKKTLSNIWYDTAASIYLYDRKIFGAGIESAGINKIVMGSDYPLTGPTHYLQQISLLSESAQKQIIRKNALRFLGIDEEH
jgi:predicted TIM-barrel fold metal-dependent hydrolase